jgi:leader peptidase (prepilin peptidase)/N-methyltransferase
VSTHLALFAAALAGMVAGAALLPLTRRQLAAAVSRADARMIGPVLTQETVPPIGRWQWAALVAASGLLPGIVWHGAGGSMAAIPPLILLLGLIQLAYCDATRRLLPKPLVYGMTAAVLGSGVAIAWHLHLWERLEIASIGAVGFFLVLFMMNLMNPRWMAFGDVRLGLAVGFGLSWIGVSAIFEGFFIANVLAAIIGVTLIGLGKASRSSGLPFGFYLALGTGITILAWT